MVKKNHSIFFFLHIFYALHIHIYINFVSGERPIGRFYIPFCLTPYPWCTLPKLLSPNLGNQEISFGLNEIVAWQAIGPAVL